MLDRLNKELLFFDGGMGTQLQESGLKVGGIPEELNIDNPELIISIHERYLNAGADFITTNTFGCNPLKMQESKYCYCDMLKAAVSNAKEAQKRTNRQKDSYIVLDIGPIGTMLAPMGSLSFDEAYEIIASQILLVKDDVDVVLFETMSDLYEVKAGILAVKENSDLPVFTTMTFEANKRTLTGVDPLTFVNVVEGLNVDALGVNCSLGPSELKEIVEEILDNAHVPVIVQPNAGLPVLKNGKTYYEVTPEQFTSEMIHLVDLGVGIVGGCCGTTPQFISAMKQNLKPIVSKRNNIYKTAVSSSSQTVVFNGQVVICGERLNPTGKKKMKLALKEERYDELVVEAIKQDQAGAHVLDVNVGLPGIDEAQTMKKVIPMLQEVVNLPLQIDSSSKEAIETACRYYNGKPLINSVNGKDEVMDAIFPIVKKYGGVVIGLTLEDGIPLKAEQRRNIALKIINKAKEYGIRKENIIIDCLTLTASAQQKEVVETLKALTMIKELGCYTVLGVSNVSFGLPNRSLLNRTFLSTALYAGLTMPIMNPLDEEMMDVIDAYNVLVNQDKDSLVYIEKHANDVINTKIKKEMNIKNDTHQTLDLYHMILRGLKDEVQKQTEIELKNKDGLSLINEVIIPALNQVGKDYESGKIFLPQLIQSASTTKIAFEVVQKTFHTKESDKKGPVLMCTVEGDIHDIGKNIVKVVLESYGYQVIDLGKDVKVEKVVEAYHQYQPKIIGLSALMTTTVINMKRTIEALHADGCQVPIWVGGAVLTADIAKEIGADYYSEDAMASVRLLNQLL
jgi:5-methyltetrahydrofolate--homocysteine methyltransferase